MNNTVEIKIVGLIDESKEEVIAFLSTQFYDAFEEDGEILKAFIKEEYFDEYQLKEIITPYPVSFSKTIIEEKNWNDLWESNFSPVIVDDFCVIRAEFHPIFEDIKHVINITPKMSFGTGHHATTFLMMEQMSALNFTNKSVVDFGTGTGVLAILAEKMGASSITAIDNDDWSIENAKENIITNNSRNILLQKAESIPLNMTYDIILANINLNVILQNIELIAKACKPATKILLSGFLITDEIQIRSSLAENSITFTSFTHQKDWICVDAKYRTG